MRQRLIFYIMFSWAGSEWWDIPNAPRHWLGVRIERFADRIGFALWFGRRAITFVFTRRQLVTHIKP